MVLPSQQCLCHRAMRLLAVDRPTDDRPKSWGYVGSFCVRSVERQKPSGENMWNQLHNHITHIWLNDCRVSNFAFNLTLHFHDPTVHAFMDHHCLRFGFCTRWALCWRSRWPAAWDWLTSSQRLKVLEITCRSVSWTRRWLYAHIVT